MKISKIWIEDFLGKLTFTPQEIAERLSSTLAEVEGVEERGSWLNEKIVAAKMIDLLPHPQADKLKIAKVSDGKKIFNLVCGAPNIQPGNIVPLVLVGGQVKTPQGEVVKIHSIKIRGIKSEGMLASALELGVDEDHQGIWILPQEWENYLGKPLTEILPEVRDVVWEIENKALTHRPDCFGQLGIAREIAAAFGLRLELPRWYQENWQPREIESVEQLRIQVEETELCPRYSAIMMKGVKIKPSPLWLQQRLLSVGLRPINNIVDITNYVMMELGQPLHAFDQRKLTQNQIIVRRAKRGEVIPTLDGETKILSFRDLVIADPKRPIALAGIIGGANTEIDSQTETIILESANFNKASIRRSSMRLGVRTEASLRFEKGLDPNLTLPALARAVDLILQLCPGAKIASKLVDVYPQPVKPKTIETTPAFINRILGSRIKAKTMITILTNLGLKTKLNQGRLTVKVPTFRSDLSLAEDLVEEVGRIYGYDKLSLILPKRDLSPAPKNKEMELAKKVKQILVGLGFDEIYTYAFVGSELYQKCRLETSNLIPLKNPLSPELAFLKNSLIPTLIEKIAFNLPNFDHFSLFELARVFIYQEEKEQLPLQPKMLVGAVVRAREEEDKILLITKGYLEELLRRILIPRLIFKPTSSVSYLHPSKAVEIWSNEVKIGVLGPIHPLIAENFSFGQTAVTIFELNFEVLKEMAKKQINYSPPIKKTLIKIDLTLRARNWQEAEKRINQIFSRLLVRLKLISYYQNKYTVRLWLIPTEKTTGKNLQKLIDKTIN